MNKKLSIITFLIAAAGSGAYVYVTNQPSEFQTYYYGSANVGHDVQFGDMVNGDVTYGLYCQNASDLIHTDEGDIYISGRAGSADNCQYVHEDLLGIAVVGWANTEEEVTQRPQNSLTISHGGDGNAGAYGTAVDFHVDAGSLSEAMPLMANILMEINAATSTPFTTAGIRNILIQSADGWKDAGGKRYGRIINVARAVDYAVNGIPVPPPCETEQCRIAAALAGGANNLLLLQ